MDVSVYVIKMSYFYLALGAFFIIFILICLSKDMYFCREVTLNVECQ